MKKMHIILLLDWISMSPIPIGSNILDWIYSNYIYSNIFQLDIFQYIRNYKLHWTILIDNFNEYSTVSHLYFHCFWFCLWICVFFLLWVDLIFTFYYFSIFRSHGVSLFNVYLFFSFFFNDFIYLRDKERKRTGSGQREKQGLNPRILRYDLNQR